MEIQRGQESGGIIMVKSKNPYIEADTGYFVVDGKKYEASTMQMKDVDGVKHCDKQRMVLVDDGKDIGRL